MLQDSYTKVTPRLRATRPVPVVRCVRAVFLRDRSVLWAVGFRTGTHACCAGILGSVVVRVTIDTKRTRRNRTAQNTRSEAI